MEVRIGSSGGSLRVLFFTFLVLFVTFHTALGIPIYGTIMKRDTASDNQKRGSSPVTLPGKSSTARESPISGLQVSLSQAKQSSPPVVTVTVTNKNKFPVTLLTYGSPVDKAALKLGIVQVTPEGASGPLTLPRIQFRRIWPPGPDQLVTLAPAGQTGSETKSEIEFDDSVLKPGQLGGKAKVLMKGQWQAVWKMAKEDIKQASLIDPAGNADAFQGDFESDELEMVA